MKIKEKLRSIEGYFLDILEEVRQIHRTLGHLRQRMADMEQTYDERWRKLYEAQITEKVNEKVDAMFGGSPPPEMER